MGWLPLYCAEQVTLREESETARNNTKVEVRMSVDRELTSVSPHYVMSSKYENSGSVSSHTSVNKSLLLTTFVTVTCEAAEEVHVVDLETTVLVVRDT